MFGGLRKKLEEVTAQVNPFDGGKTAATVRANRAAPPAQTVRRPTPPSYGRGVTGAVNRVRDVFDANTEQDRFRRNQAEIDRVTREARNTINSLSTGQEASLPTMPKFNQSYKEQQLDIGNKRPYQNVGAALLGNTARFLNTGEQARQEVIDTARLYGAQARGDIEDVASTNRRIQERQQREYQPDSGLLSQGTIFDKPEDFNQMGAKDLTKRVAATAAGTGLEIAPVTKGAGVATNLLSKAPNAVARGAMRAGAGAVEGAAQDVLEQQFTRDNYSPMQTAASAAFGGVLAGAAPVVGAATKRATTSLVNNRTPLNEVGAVGKNVNQPIDPLESLKQEARKYKSAEEFVKSNTNSYHSTSATLKGDLRAGHGNAGMAIYTHRNPETARLAGAMQGDGNILDEVAHPVRIDPNAKIYKMRKGGYPSKLEQQKILKQGYDGVEMKDGEIAIYKTDKVKYAQQLTDLYNQATKPQPTTSLVEPKGVILKETKPRNGRVDTVRAARDPETGRMRTTVQTEDVPVRADRDPYIEEYAGVLRDMESGRKGGQLIDTGDGKVRVTEHSPFYSKYFEENGHPPTRKDWYDEAQRQVSEGKADPAFMEYYNSMNANRMSSNERVIENKPPRRRQTSEEWQSLLSQAEKEGVRPTKKTALTKRAEYNEQIKEAVKAGDLKRANELRKQAEQFNAEVKVQTRENMPKNAEEVITDQGQYKVPASLKDKETKKRFIAVTKEYLGETSSRKIERDAKNLELTGKYDLTDREKINAILALDDSTIKPVNSKVAAYVEEFRKLTDTAYSDYTSAGIKMGFVSDYFPRIYKHPTTGEAIDGQTFRLLQAGSARQRGREAELIKPDSLVYKDPTKMLDEYYRSLDNAVAGQKYLANLEKEGILQVSNEPIRGLRPIIAEGLQRPDGMIYYAPKDVATKLNRLFGSKEATNFVEHVLSGAAKLNSLVQSFVLSGGIPNTPVNAFGIMQVMKEGMALHPLKAGKAFFGAGFSKDFSKKLFAQKKDILKLMAENDVAPRVDLQQVSKSGTQRIKEAKGVVRTADQVWDEFTNDATFGRFMPALEIMHFEQVYKQALKRKDSKEAARIAAESVKNFYGRTSDYKLAVRSGATQDAAGALLFAPRFRESMVNFWLKNAKSIPNFYKKEYRDNVKFLTAAAVMYAGFEGANKAMNGVWMHDNPDGKKDKLLVPDKYIPWDTGGKDVGIPYLSSVATVPRNLIQGGFNLATGRFDEAAKNARSFLSMPLNTIGDIATNEDYFGNPIVDEDSSPLQKFTQAGAYVAKSNMQPWIREGLNVAGRNLPDETQKALGIKDKGLFETVSNAAESPLRFYDPKYYRYDDAWTPKGGKDEKFTIAQQRERSKVKKEIDAIPDSLGLDKKQKAEYKALNTYDFDDDGNLKLDSDPFYQAKRATKLQDDGVFEAMKKKAEAEYKLNGKPIDPLYTLTGAKRRIILWKKTLPQGTEDPTIKNIYKTEWYQSYRAAEDKYFREKLAYNDKMGYKNEKRANTNPYPEPSPELQDKLDEYYKLPSGTGARSAFLKNNPDVLAQWDAVDNWKNGERAKVGLGEVEDRDEQYANRYGKGSSGRSGRRGKRSPEFDWTKNLFESGTSSTSLTKALRKIMDDATIKSGKKA